MALEKARTFVRRAPIRALVCAWGLTGCGASAAPPLDAAGATDGPFDSSEAAAATVDVASRLPGRPSIDGADGSDPATDAGDSGGSLDGYDASGSADQRGAAGAHWSSVEAPGLVRLTAEAVWGSGPNDVWAVGDDEVILHWTGALWSLVVGPGANGTFRGVWGSGPNDVWAVGTPGILHWNGASWAPPFSPAQLALFAVWGSGPNDVWAVGDQNVVLHFDGNAWKSTVPASGMNTVLSGVWGSGPGDVWAVGSVIAHWDGKTWTLSSPPSATPSLRGVWGSGPNDVWAVGTGLSDMIHWNGSEWLVVGGLGSPNELEGVWGSGPDDVWVVGTNTRGQSGPLLHLDHGTWTRVTDVFVDLMGFSESLHGVWGSPNDVWAVGGGPLGPTLHFGP